MEFVRFLKENHLSFHKDNSAYWKDKIYYWVKLEDACVCFIAIKNPDEESNHWTVWSDDMCSEWLEKDFAGDEVKETAWKYVDHLKEKDYIKTCIELYTDFYTEDLGKEFDDVCGCTFRIDNPKDEDLPFLKKIVEIRMKEINSKKVFGGI